MRNLKNADGVVPFLCLVEQADIVVEYFHRNVKNHRLLQFIGNIASAEAEENFVKQGDEFDVVAQTGIVGNRKNQSRSGEWCPGEDSNFHSLARTGT